MTYPRVANDCSIGSVLQSANRGGNLSGLTSLATELSAKRLRLLKEAFPKAGRVALLLEPDSVGSVSQAKIIEGVAPRLGMRVTQIEVKQPADIEPGIKSTAAYVDKILKGAMPGDLPVQQPLKFEMVVNMKTAKALGFKFSEAFMIRVDRVIE